MRLLRRGTFMETASDPERAAEIAAQRMRRFALDAAVIFRGIRITVAAIGQEDEFVEKIEPRRSREPALQLGRHRPEPMYPEERTAQHLAQGPRPAQARPQLAPK